jgi:hypothetical protein
MPVILHIVGRPPITIFTTNNVGHPAAGSGWRLNGDGLRAFPPSTVSGCSRTDRTQLLPAVNFSFNFGQAGTTAAD